MYTTLLLVFFAFLIIGIACNFLLFYTEKQHKQNTRFITSERLIVFVIEILIAVIGFGVTLSITNANEKQMEKEKAIRMLEQTVEYTDRQIEMDRSYLVMHNNKKIESDVLLISDVISVDYYYNVLSNEIILQNANMNTYGEIMKHLSWVEYSDNCAKEAEDSLIYTYLYRRYNHLKKVRELLSICCNEMSGEISTKEAEELCKAIKYEKEKDTEDTGSAS